MCALLTRFQRDEAGGIAAVAAGSITALAFVSAFAVDLGSMNLAKRRAQGQVDVAAMASAAHLDRASDMAALSLTENGVAAPDRLIVETGIYRGDMRIAPQDRFQPATGPDVNAVRVAMQTRTPLYFGRLLIDRNELPVSVEAIAAVTRSAGFSVGSRLARLDGGVLNGLLGALTGSSVSLSLMDYEALAATDVSLFGTMDGLASRLGLVAGTYEDVLAAQIGIGDLAVTLAEAPLTDARSREALRAIAAAPGSMGRQAPLGRLVDPGPYGPLPVSQRPALDVTVSALDLLMAQAQIASGNRMIETGLALNLPGIASAQLSLAIGERPQGGHWLVLGPEGVSAHTAQTRLLLDVRLLGSGLLSSTQVRVPIYAELAAADARLSRIVCGSGPADLRVSVDVKPGIVDAWIGDVTPALMSNFTSPVSVREADLVRLPLVAVRGRAHAAMSNVDADRLVFSHADITQKAVRTVRTRDFTTSLTQSLLGDLTLRPEVAGIPLLDLGAITRAVSGLIGTVTPALDGVLATLTSTLGLGLGEADVRVTSVRCDGAVLVR